ncbi:MAG: flagellar hook-basal body complex protein [Hyphomicrobiales bacterium]|nr:flagellar hook-basal body complex protein [Hyphomicrobiales bacterium]
MGVYDAMSNAVVGLQAQAYALQNISGNIANSSTTGYKSVETAFEDLLTSSGTSSSSQNSASVTARSVTTNTVQGNISATSVSTNMAISGDGYFQVQAKTGETDGQVNLSGTYYYTRQGDFTMNADGYMTNSAGYYLTGLPIDPTTGNTTGTTAESIKIDTGIIPAKATTTVDYEANLPSASSVTTISATDMTNSTGYPTTIAAADNSTFLSESLSGGSVTLYDEQGNDISLNLRWAKTASDTWSLYYQSDSTATGASAEWTLASSSSFTFDSTGALTSPTSSSITLSGLTIDGTNLGNVGFSFGSNLTQYNSGTTVSQTVLSQDGYSAGTYTGLSISSDGILTASYSNGKTVDLYKIGVYSFDGDAELLAVSGNAYQATKESGSPYLSSAATITSSALEASNVDITDQFSKMIVTQQAYSANSKVISTANNMMQAVLDIIR